MAAKHLPARNLFENTHSVSVMIMYGQMDRTSRGIPAALINIHAAHLLSVLFLLRSCAVTDWTRCEVKGHTVHLTFPQDIFGNTLILECKRNSFTLHTRSYFP